MNAVIPSATGQDRLRFSHCPHFAKRNVPRKMIEAAGAGDDRLFGREPSMRFDPLHHLLSGLDIGGLHVNGADTKLFVAKVLLVVRRHIVFDEIAVTLNFADEIGLVAALVEIAVANLSIVIRAHGVIALADMNHHMNIIGQSFDRHVDRIDRRADLLVTGHREVGLVDLDMLAARFGQAPKVLMQ